MKATKPIDPTNLAPVRVQKFLADCGLCSRREAEQWIRDGEITVNGAIAELGQKVTPGKDFLKLRNKPVLARQIVKPITLAINKPKGYLSSNRDPFHAQTIFDLLPKEYQGMKLFCAGRLDKDSEGLLILTNDGNLANRIMHPSNEIIKRYRVTLNRAFDPSRIPSILEGVERDGEKLFAKKIIPAAALGPDHEKRLEIHLSQGRKREVRRLMEAFGYYVKQLKRFQIGRFVLKTIPVGAVKLLTENDIKLLFKN